MTKEQFIIYYKEALDRAMCAFSKAHGAITAKPERFEVHAPDSKGRIITENEAIDAIFLSESIFYKIIDVGIISMPTAPLGFIRVSGHAPCPFEETLNPHDLGPFKALEPLTSYQ